MRNANFYGIEGMSIPVQGHRDGYDAVDEKGCVDVQEGVGLVEYDWGFVGAHETGRAVYE
ncbi:MAG: hypothetical protein F4Y49_02050 [Dehalococcoidia bacterium]|nr:hypothetical protein [Dehalococcoidia bacterium]